MGVLTDDMTRLCDEIRTLHKVRREFMKDLVHETKERKSVVSKRRASFSSTHTEMARKMKADRSGFVSNLKGVVTRLRQEVREDLAGVRQAWLNPAASGHKPVELEEWKREEAEVRVRGEEKEKALKEQGHIEMETGAKEEEPEEAEEAEEVGETEKSAGVKTKLKGKRRRKG